MNFNSIKLAVTLVLLLPFQQVLQADDTEIFTAGNIDNTVNPQVMIIFDNSGSMDNYTPYGHSQRTKKIDLAKEAISALINDNPDVQFGLTIFNQQETSKGKYGGNIYKALKGRDTQEIQSLVSAVNGLPPDTWTPLCDTYYEVYRYFTGQSVEYGLFSASRDTSVESNKIYQTPLNSCQNLYVIYMTDGEPTKDGGSYSSIEDLTGETCSSYNGNKNCLPTLAGYMASPGLGGLDNNPYTGNQKAFTYTIGFATDQQLLRDTADRGNGVCYTTVGNNTDSTTGCVVVENIAAAFQGALGEILQQTSTFVSPAVAVNSFKRTESLDNAYYAMFLPSESSRWTGNLKKLKIYKRDSTTGCNALDIHTLGIVVDRGCDPAFDDGSNRIADGRSTYWNTINDGSEVGSGGLGAALLNTRGAFYTNLVNNSGNEYLGSVDNIDVSRFGISDSANYTTANLINWIKGLDNDGNTLSWVLGDILHSRPVTLNYGDTDGTGSKYNDTNPNLRLVFGTNYGLLHFIEDQGNSVVENWSFFAGETASNIPKLYENRDDAGHPYGLDGQVSVIRLDYNNDGNIKHTDGDRMILYFGMRRGGRSYYAIDVSNPDGAPTLLWRIDNQTAGYSELGQSWSTPVPMIIPGHREVISTTESGITTNTINYKYVLAFGAGYDNTNDDDRIGEAFTDANGDTHTVRKYSQKGRGVFFVDAATGTLVKSFTAPDDISAANPVKYESSLLKWSVVSSPAPMDSNGDGLIDRIYFSDTGGNIFRVDIGKAYLDANGPNAESSIWSMIKLAQLGADETDVRPSPDTTSDRRFMYQPELVRTTYRGTAYDAVVLGSGNRANPMATTNTDRYYVIRDTNIFYTRFGTCNECTTPPNVITHSSLYNASSNLIQQGTEQEKSTGMSLLDTKSGWYINLSASGEKTTTTGDVYSGQLLYSTYSPSSAPGANICTPSVGSSRFYVLDLHTASAIRDVDGDNNKQADDRFSLLSVVGTPGDATTVSLSEGSNLIDLNTGYSGATNEVGIHRSGWIEQ